MVLDQWTVNPKDLVFEQELGRGAYGVVYRGKWRQSPVAVKVMHVDNMDFQALNNFQAESELMKRLRNHQNVVMFLGICDEPLCVVTEFMEGGSLYALLHSDQKIPDNIRNQMVIDIARGMLHLHCENIIHRDLAARNVLLTGDYRAKISDFGLSRINSEAGNKTNSEVGPLKWMAPECIKDRQYGIPSDVWAFGITLIEIFSRKDPYPTMDALSAATRICLKEMVATAPLNSPQLIATMIIECCQFEVEGRPNFEYIVKELEKLN